jgi:hypothetical protein
MTTIWWPEVSMSMTSHNNRFLNVITSKFEKYYSLFHQKLWKTQFYSFFYNLVFSRVTPYIFTPGLTYLTYCVILFYLVYLCYLIIIFIRFKQFFFFFLPIKGGYLKNIATLNRVFWAILKASRQFFLDFPSF